MNRIKCQLKFSFDVVQYLKSVIDSNAHKFCELYPIRNMDI